MSLARDRDKAHKYHQPSLTNPNTYSSFFVDPASGYSNTSSWPNAKDINYNLNQAANLGLKFLKEYPNEVKNYTFDPKTGKKNTYNRAYGQAGDEGQSYFQFGKNLYQQDKVIKNPPQVEKDHIVKIPKPKYDMMNIDVPEPTYKDELKVPKPTNTENAPGQFWNPTKYKAQVGREDIDIPGLASDVANLSIRHGNYFPERRVFDPVQGSTGAAFIQGGKDLVKDITGGKKYRNYLNDARTFINW